MNIYQTCPNQNHVQNQILIGRDWYVIYTRSWFRSCMGLRLRSRLGNFGKISRDFWKYSSRPGFSVYNLGKITEIWSRLIFFVYCSLNLNTVIVLLPRKRREKRPRSRNSRPNRDLGLDLRHRDGHVWFEPGALAAVDREEELGCVVYIGEATGPVSTLSVVQCQYGGYYCRLQCIDGWRNVGACVDINADMVMIVAG